MAAGALLTLWEVVNVAGRVVRRSAILLLKSCICKHACTHGCTCMCTSVVPSREGVRPLAHRPGGLGWLGGDMYQAYNGISAARLREASWLKSRVSNPSGNCVELAELPCGEIAIRNSRFPDGPALLYTRAEIDAFIKGAKDGDFDHMLA